jgi:hypothetical protein
MYLGRVLPHISSMRGSILLIAVASCAAAVTPAAARDTFAGCTQGVRSGTTIFRFCGPARATVTVDGKTYHVSNGKCQRLVGGTVFAVDIGATTPLNEKPKYTYFGAEVRPPRPGAHSGQLVSIAVPGARFSLQRATIILKPSLRGGRFSGVLASGTTASGLFTC